VPHRVGPFAEFFCPLRPDWNISLFRPTPSPPRCQTTPLRTGRVRGAVPRDPAKLRRTQESAAGRRAEDANNAPVGCGSSVPGFGGRCRAVITCCIGISGPTKDSPPAQHHLGNANIAPQTLPRSEHRPESRTADFDLGGWIHAHLDRRLGWRTPSPPRHPAGLYRFCIGRCGLGVPFRAGGFNRFRDPPNRSLL